MMRGLYVITSNNFTSAEVLLAEVEQAVIGGAFVVQYRDKNSAPARREQIALAMSVLCHERGAMLIINDDVELAQKVSADGVHIGQDDMALVHAREHLGRGKIIGVSCYNDVGKVRQAEVEGANYIALGRFFPSNSKPDADAVSIATLKAVRQQVALPIVAIGGITAQNGAPLIRAGADILAVIDGVFGQPDITQSARDIAALF